MALASGVQLGPYEILAALGAGGMGAVYRARDSRLGRDVAIKVLPPAFNADPDRLRRFEQEARAAAALNHPNILAVHDIGTYQGAPYVVSELLEGTTLRAALATGALPVRKAFDYAIQICSGLAAAHEKGVVHRDLKPENLFITRDGRVKILDFGLAKLTEAMGADAGAPVSIIATQPMDTTPGLVMGTVGYMSPEQVRGQPADRRSDLFSFGAIFYEMLSGDRAFTGDTAADTMSAILTKEPPDLTATRGEVSPTLERVVRHCLEKTPERRFQSAGDLAFAIASLSERSSSGAVPSSPTRSLFRWRERLAWIATVAWFAIALVAMLWTARRVPTVGPPRVTRLAITPASPVALTLPSGTAEAGRDIAISPDGRRIAYVGDAGSELFLRPLDRLETVSVGGVQAPRHPFFSPDGAWLGFFDGTSIKKVLAEGGPAIKVATIVGLPRGAAWGRENTIAFATSDTTTGIWKVPAAGGEPAVVTTPDQSGGRDHLWPEFLPDGRTVLFTIWGGRPDDSTIAAVDLSNGHVTSIVRGGVAAHYVSSGHLVFGAAGTLRAATFDLSRRAVVGAAIPVIQPLIVSRYGAGDFDVSADGTLVYASLDRRVPVHSLVWVTRAGKEEMIDAPPHVHWYPRLSPDGTRLALDVREDGADIWIWEFARHALTRFTFGPTLSEHPAWTSDSRRLIFSSGPLGGMNLFWQAADGTGRPQRLTQSPNDQRSYSVSPDGQWLSFRQDSAKQDLMKLELGGSHRVEPLLQTPFNESNGDISPDGRWLAFQSNETGRDEIYVRPLPNTSTGRWQISVVGGIQPKWSPAGHELFFLASNGAVMSATVEHGSSSRLSGTPVKLFDGHYFYGGGQKVNALGWTYDVSRDGKRFIMIKPAPETIATPSIVVVQHWFEELKARVPAQK
jgi:serine/threonine-protein kinase